MREVRFVILGIGLQFDLGSWGMIRVGDGDGDFSSFFPLQTFTFSFYQKTEVENRDRN
jgi:hypothetical protein